VLKFEPGCNLAPVRVVSPVWVVLERLQDHLLALRWVPVHCVQFCRFGDRLGLYPLTRIGHRSDGVSLRLDPAPAMSQSSRGVHTCRSDVPAVPRRHEQTHGRFPRRRSRFMVAPATLRPRQVE